MSISERLGLVACISSDVQRTAVLFGNPRRTRVNHPPSWPTCCCQHIFFFVGRCSETTGKRTARGSSRIPRTQDEHCTPHTGTPIGSQFLTSHAMRPPSWEGRPTPKRANVVTHCLPLTLPAGHCCTRAVRTEQDGHVSVSTQVRNGGRERLRHRSEPIWFKHILFKRNIKTIQ